MEKAAASMKGRMGRLLPWRRAPRKARGAARMPWQRRKIAVIAIIIGVVVALIELPMPAEDAFRA
ncbi:MAG: hypothetical protein V2J51_04695, partial [Erythrobacter sp.]|nr:hypothetical protein [Erythrobacter sp.]